MNNEITNEFRAACFAAYWGANTISAPYGAQPKRMLQGKISATNTIFIDIKYPEWQSQHPIILSDCKLILTPLSEISDEDAIEVAKMNFHGHTEYPQIDLGRALVRKLNKHIYCENPIQIIDFLRSRSYDCGFRHIPSLIDAGIAIKK